ncbi:MAG: DUF4391 domain-containing protein [Bacteroidaceae bacterium]|nr:DUF4391 domain-containing protein [Bacteroidaceae bacterium]
MYGLPQTTEVRKQLPKKAIYAKFDLKPSQRESFDADIARIDIVAVISPSTVPAIAEGKEVKEIYLLALQMKRKEYDSKNIALLTKLIPQRMVFALQFEEQTQFAIYHTKLISSAWQPTDDATLPLSGLNLDTVWENIVTHIGQIEVEEGNTLAEQIASNDQRAKLLAQISTLERKMANEKQPRRKREHFEQIKKLKSQI